MKLNYTFEISKFKNNNSTKMSTFNNHINNLKYYFYKNIQKFKTLNNINKKLNHMTNYYVIRQQKTKKRNKLEKNRTFSDFLFVFSLIFYYYHSQIDR